MADDKPAKKTYTTPVVTEWGTVADLTRGGLGLLGDGLLGAQSSGGGGSGSTH
jgi:hypothetical protein